MKVAELMNVSDVLILPSKKEGYPLVLLEALACGTVCVSNSWEEFLKYYLILI